MNVNAASGDRVFGTFSGNIRLADETILTITEGRFAVTIVGGLDGLGGGD